MVDIGPRDPGVRAAPSDFSMFENLDLEALRDMHDRDCRESRCAVRDGLDRAIQARQPCQGYPAECVLAEVIELRVAQENWRQ
ncbi:hypothetical protein JK358_17310 [Nocardia sp. 2]|uniref:Transcription factor WhiB n=1 Tax=Nocardia acididurans TaxID=2802282 RepID=A0ABS1M7G9_9NOCA|nr:hypothetical protein [Nocardia acididurans]MBL1076159.1 hypothetical protein [Nocardia acididurans]